MQSHQVIRAAFDKASPKQIAADLGVSLSLVYKWAEPPGTESGSRNPLDRVAQLIETTNDRRIIDWLCRQAGGYFVPNPSAQARKMEVLPATHEIVAQFGAMLAQISTAAKDHVVTPAEAAEIRDCWDSLKSYTEAFVRSCEEGDFATMRKLLPQGSV